MHSVHQHWDPLKVCAVGRSFPPEFYSRIKNPRVRNSLERVAIETEEDYQKLIAKLKEFNVTVLRTDVSEDPEVYVNNDGVLSVPPPMCPRDYTAMVGNTFYMPGDNYGENFDVDMVMSEMFEHIYTSNGDNTAYDICKELEDIIEPNNLSPEDAFNKFKSRMKRGRKGVHMHTDLMISLPHRDLHAVKLKNILDFKSMINGILV